MRPYVEELLAFPSSPVKDQVDATSSAFTLLSSMGSIDDRNSVEIGVYSSGREYGEGWQSPDAGVADMHNHKDDESNDGYGDDGFNVRGSLF